MGGGDWGYAEHNGPCTWSSNYPCAAGQRQSPIDVIPSLTKADSSLSVKPLHWGYDPSNTLRLNNTGYGWKADVDGTGSSLQGGPLEDQYQLEQFHCHWGRNSSCGSEHKVNGKSYPGELHFVHWNREKFPDFATAAESEDGLAVLAVFLKVGREHQEIGKLTRLLPHVTFSNESVEFDTSFDPADCIPANHSYWTYPGSLTTPPCSESVTWIIFRDPIEVSEEQLTAFRALRSHRRGEVPIGECGGCVIQNYRDPLPVNERTVRYCEQ